jgi:hypothetical protein
MIRLLIYIIVLILTFLGSCNKQQASVNLSEKTRYEKWMEDIVYFEKEFLNNAKTYSKESKASCKVILTNLKTKVHNLSDIQIRLELSKCVVMANNAHTTLPLPRMDKIPLRFYRFADGLYITKTDSTSSKYLGSKVLKINSIEVDKVEKRLFPYLSGIERWKKYKTLNLITAPEILHGIGISKKDSLTLSLLKGNDTLEVSFGAKNIEKDRYWFEAWANLYPINTKNNNWKFVKNNTENLPLYLKNAEEGVSYKFIDTEKIAYFNINSFWEKCPDFKGKINNFLNILKTKTDYNVVIDLRFYTGGDYGFATKLATDPPKIINADKKIYLITSNKTYSAGIVTAARIKYYAKDKIVIVGEEVGDRLKFWAEGVARKLPNSGIAIYDARKEHDWKDNNHSLFRTHFPNFIYGIAAKNLKVDKEIKLSYKDYIDNKDPILDWIINNKN